MDNITTIGLDTAKSVFQVHDQRGHQQKDDSYRSNPRKRMWSYVTINLETANNEVAAEVTRPVDRSEDWMAHYTELTARVTMLRQVGVAPPPTLVKLLK